MTDAEKWGLILGTIVVVAVVIFVIGALIQLRQRRSERVRSAVDLVNEFSMAATHVASMPDDNNRRTIERVLNASRRELDEMVPEPTPAGPNLDHWN